MPLLKKIHLRLKNLQDLRGAHKHILESQLIDKLQNGGKKFDVHCDNFSLITLLLLLEYQHDIHVIVAKTVNQAITTPLTLHGVTLLEFLKTGLDVLNLQAIQIDPSSIVIKSKI